ncbi:hypothetical protein H072_11175 [Dactylellina haptotyla CBS 200.50]|uniref:Uncharacterized protein n=1 Tax=Dactylellina haptotyla (strain CBS 200.50) TaxID=1284197 RepID=S8B8S0_DACHA|nr:hypothetical protein H072_11175 [Dactylellina haptotyla CBS 200.50]
MVGKSSGNGTQYSRMVLLIAPLTTNIVFFGLPPIAPQPTSSVPGIAQGGKGCRGLEELGVTITSTRSLMVYCQEELASIDLVPITARAAHASCTQLSESIEDRQRQIRFEVLRKRGIETPTMLIGDNRLRALREYEELEERARPITDPLPVISEAVRAQITEEENKEIDHKDGKKVRDDHAEESQKIPKIIEALKKLKSKLARAMKDKLEDKGNRLRKSKKKDAPNPQPGQLRAVQALRGQGSKEVRLQAQPPAQQRQTDNRAGLQESDAPYGSQPARQVRRDQQFSSVVMDTDSRRYREFIRESFYLHPEGFADEIGEYHAFVAWGEGNPYIGVSDDSLHLSFYKAQGIDVPSAESEERLFNLPIPLVAVVPTEPTRTKTCR